MHFKIHGQGKKNLHGDGLAIWYTKDRMRPGIGTLGCSCVGYDRLVFHVFSFEKGMSPQCQKFPSALMSVGEDWPV